MVNAGVLDHARGVRPAMTKQVSWSQGHWKLRDERYTFLSLKVSNEDGEYFFDIDILAENQESTDEGWRQ